VRILGRYIGRWVVGATLLALAVLLALFTVFALIDQLGDVGKGRFGLADMVEYLVLTTPRRVYELIPVATLLGTLLGLGVLASHSELTVIRAAGVSAWRIAAATLKAVALPIIAGIIIGDFVVPAADDLAETRRSIALTSQIALKTRTGFWARDGQRFVNIREVLPDRRLADVYIYAFDEKRRLRTAVRAAGARAVADRWILEEVSESVISAERVESRSATSLPWEAPLAADLVDLAVIRPDRASSADLLRYVRFLRGNGQDPALYELALWSKLTMPLTAGAMALLAIPFVFGPLRSVGMGQRVLAGSLVGVSFHILSQATAQVGLVYGLPPAVGATVPTLAVAALATWLLRRAS